MAVAAPPPDRPTTPADRRFYTTMSVAAALIVVVGFAPTYYLRARFTADALPLHLHLHGALFTAWFVFLVLQALLVAGGRTTWHRALGPAGALLAACVVAAGTYAGLATGRREAVFDPEGARAFLTIPLSSMLVFAILCACGVIWRHRPQAHKRLMLLATISLLDAPLARLPGAPGATGIALLVGLLVAVTLVYDLASRGRVHPASVWGGALVLAGLLLRDVVGRSSGWQRLAATLIG